MSISDEELSRRFSEAVDWLHAPSNNGLQAIAAMTLLIWNARYTLGATLAQIETLFLRQNSDALIRKKFSYAKSLAHHWRAGLPDVIRQAKSDDAARQAVMSWLAGKDVRNQEELSKIWYRPFDAPQAPKGQVERLSTQIAGALKNRDVFYEYTPAEFARAIIGKLSLPQAEEFTQATVTALSTKRQDQ